VRQQSQVIVGGAAVGAIVGAAVSYFFFTDRGRVLRDQIVPAIDDARRDFTHVQGTILTAAALALDGLRMVEDFSRRGAPTAQTSHVSH
jgi:gas vesicle protein